MLDQNDNNLCNELGQPWAASTNQKDRAFSLPIPSVGFYVSKKGNEGRFKSQHYKTSGTGTIEKEASPEFEEEGPELIESSSEIEIELPVKKKVKRKSKKDSLDISQKSVTSPLPRNRSS
jgi:hypothetical protein